jgi:hypothetical protein
VCSSDLALGAPLSGGERFSVGERGYRVIRALGSGQYHIEPPLREAVTAGASVNFDWPAVKCRVAPGESFAPTLRIGRYGDASIRFLENAA